MDNFLIAYLTAEGVTALTTIMSNILVLAAILRTPKLHTVTNVFICNLALADIMVGFLVVPIAVAFSVGRSMNFYECLIMSCLIIMLTNVSIFMLLTVALERFWAIKAPFHYHRTMTVRRAIYANVFIWVLGILFGLVPMYGWNGGYSGYGPCSFPKVMAYEYMVYFQFFVVTLVPLFIMFCVYMSILKTVRKHVRRDTITSISFPAPEDQKMPKKKISKDHRDAKLFAIIILMFAFCWLPINLFNAVSLFCPTCYFPEETLNAAIFLSHANSSVNPFLFAGSNSQIKNAISNMLHCKSPENSLIISKSYQISIRRTTGGRTPVTPCSYSPQLVRHDVIDTSLTLNEIKPESSRISCISFSDIISLNIIPESSV